jgi:hypothetical protein
LAPAPRSAGFTLLRFRAFLVLRRRNDPALLSTCDPGENTWTLDPELLRIARPLFGAGDTRC